MNTENIIKMAQEAGLHSVELLDLYGGNVKDSELDKLRRLERFAALVAAAAYEECAKVCDLMEQQAEGTECCKWPTPADCAAVIRARSTP